MRILRKGKMRIATCPYCETVLLYDIEKDVHFDKIELHGINEIRSAKIYNITCPVCDQEIDVTNEVK